MSPSDSAVPATVPIALRGSDADVWAWEKQVTGTCDCGQEDCAAIYVQSPRGRVEAQRDGGSFSAVVPLVAGENEVVAVCQHPDGSLSTSNLLNFKGSLRDRPKAWIRLSIEDGAVVLDGSESTPSEGSDAAIVDYAWSARADNPEQLLVSADGGGEEQPLDGEVGGARLVLVPPTVDGEYYVTLRVVDAEGREDASTTYFVVEGGEARIPDYATENTAWVEQAIVYGVIVRLFGNEGFRDITARLDYLRDLGVNALWLSPVNLSPRGDYGYAVTGYFELNPIYGTKDDFREMVQAAHARGIRVLMDFVPNHSSAQHPYYRDAEENGRESPYYDFYDRDENGEVTHYFNWEHLPNLNYDNPEVRRFMLAAFSYWVREFDVDGFRVDVAWGIRERRPDFWPEWRRELKRIKPDLLLLAEAGARDDYYFDNGYDAAYDWDAQLGHWAWTRVFDSPELLTYNLHSALTNQRRGFHEDALIFRFMNNNDTGTRFITTHGPDLTRVFAALLLTLPGIPCVYTADELGEWYRPYSDPVPLAWEEKYEGLRDYYKKLIGLRKEVASLHSRQWLPLTVNPSRQLYAYVRYLEPAGEPVLVLLNFSDEDVEAEVTLPEEFQALAEGGTLLDLLADEQVQVSRASPLRIAMPAFTARIMRQA